MAAHRNARISRVLLLAIFSVIVGAAAPAQNVPASAREAAKLPQFASRLAHPAHAPASRANPLARPASRSGPPQFGVIYDNGPINGTTDAWTINSGFVVSDTLTIQGGAGPINGMNFGAWLTPGDVLESVQISITSSEFGGTTYFNEVVNFTQSGCSGNQYGFNICTESSDNFSGPNLAAGTYWVNLANAVVNTGDPVYWDENSGSGCDSQGCPSSASENSVGTIPSEAFSVLGSTCVSRVEERPANAAKVVTVPPSPTQSYRVLYNFTGAADGGSPQGLVIDVAGNLYGATNAGGLFGQGTAFKLAPGASGWLFNRLYSFPANNGPSSTLVLGAAGTLFGTSAGGGQGDGTLFSLSPPGNVLPSVFSNWLETLLYEFTGGSDGANPQGSIVVDSANNVYGTATVGGANGGGTLYEFTNGGLQVLHAFPAFPGDGGFPTAVVQGSDGLHGITLGSVTSSSAPGVSVLYTTAGGYQVLHNFMNDPGPPQSLVADQAGNLYVTISYISYGRSSYYSRPSSFLSGPPCDYLNTDVDQLSPPGWNPSLLATFGHNGIPGTGVSVSTDASGNLYGTTSDGGQYFHGNVFKLTCCWNYTDLYDFSGGDDGSMPTVAPVVDAQGNIYGTTSQGGASGQGANGKGVVWEISP